MIKVFLDSSVLFSAIFSDKGYARDLFDLLEVFIETVSIKVVKSPNKTLVAQVAQYTHVKDAPVVASALEQKVDYLVSFDRKDLVKNNQVKTESKLKIVMPKEVVLLLN